MVVVSLTKRDESLMGAGMHTWKVEPRAPLRWDGASSPTYTGQMTDERPTPTPTTSRNNTMIQISEKTELPMQPTNVSKPEVCSTTSRPRSRSSVHHHDDDDGDDDDDDQ